jgi:predicted DsbA family dithiol-disulfide isomerase
MMNVELRYFTDPACIWSWAFEPKLRRLLWEFGDELAVRPVMGGLARSYGPSYRDEEGRIGAGSDCFSDLMAHWLDVSAKGGMPCDPRLWTEAKITSTYPVCMAVIAAGEQGPGARMAYLRRAREALLTERKKLDFAEALIAEAGAAGIDAERFAIDLRSNAIVEQFAAELDAARAVPPPAREAGQVKRTEGRERVSFPSLVFRGDSGTEHGVFGFQPYEAARAAAIAAGAVAQAERRAEPLEAIRRFGRCATRELEELSGLPRPVIEAELWTGAREWRLRAVPVLTGTFWELA